MSPAFRAVIHDEFEWSLTLKSDVCRMALRASQINAKWINITSMYFIFFNLSSHNNDDTINELWSSRVRPADK